MAKKQLTAAQYAAAHKAFMDTVGPEMVGGATGRKWKKFKGNGPVAKWITARQFDKYVAQGGDPGDMNSWIAFLKELMPFIIQIVMMFL